MGRVGRAATQVLCVSHVLQKHRANEASATGVGCLQVKIRESMRGKAGEEEEPVLLALPAEGAPAAQVLQRMRSRVRPSNFNTSLHSAACMQE